MILNYIRTLGKKQQGFPPLSENFIFSGDEVIIKKDPLKYYGFPTMTKIGSKIIMGWKDGTAHNLDLSASTLRIMDSYDGINWTNERVISEPNRAGFTLTNLWLSTIDNRVFVSYHDAKTPQSPPLYLDRMGWIKYSDDGGLTWSAPHHLTSSVLDKYVIPHSKIIKSLDGTKLIMGVWGVKTGDVDRQNIHIMKSNDFGATWYGSGNIDTGGSASAETAIIRNSQGNLIIRAALQSKTWISYDDGETFQVLNDYEAVGNPILHKINDSLYMFGRRSSDTTLRVHKSTDGGLTWIHKQLIDDYTDFDSYPAGGYCDICEIHGKLLCVYYTSKINNEKSYLASKFAVNL